MLAAANDAVLAGAAPDRLAATTCRVAVERGGLRMAWIGTVRDHRIEPVAAAGAGTEYVRAIEVSVDARDERSRGPTGTAIRTASTVVCDDIDSDPRMVPWREMATRHGHRSSAAFPLVGPTGVIGALSVYAGEPGWFGVDERELLERLAANVAHGWHDAHRDVLLDALDERVLLVAPDGRVLAANRAGRDLLGARDEPRDDLAALCAARPGDGTAVTVLDGRGRARTMRATCRPGPDGTTVIRLRAD